MSLLIYGAYGYTGRLITRMATDHDLRPILAGRSAKPLRGLANENNLPRRVFGLEDPEEVREMLEDVDVVLHCAGPFANTAEPMVEACLDTGTHYLDITGEIDVFEAMAARDERAQEAGIMLLSGTGFDVVPTDCLAAHLAQQLPSATSLEIAFMGLGRVSRGTLKTAISQFGDGGRVRRGGTIEVVPPGWNERTVDFGDNGPGERTVVTIPWGDVSTAYHSTGIPNVTTYTYLPQPARTFLKLSQYFQWLLSSDVVQRLLQAWVDLQPPGPTAQERERGKSFVWASARDGQGHYVTGRLRGPEGYTFTANAALNAARHVLGGTFTPGYQTPSTAFGPDFALDVPGTQREIVDAKLPETA